MSNYENEAPSGEFTDNSYVGGGANEQVPVVSDETKVEDPIDGAQADSDAQLGIYLPFPHPSLIPYNPLLFPYYAFPFPLLYSFIYIPSLLFAPSHLAPHR